MKIIKCVMMIMCLLSFGSVMAQKKTKAERKIEIARMVKDTVESRTFQIDVHTAMPMSGRNVPLTSYFYLRVDNDSVVSYLPYFGRAYSIPYGGGEGLDFETSLLNYKQTTGTKGEYTITFNARTFEDYYTFCIEIYPNGSASVAVNMQRRQSISFLGNLVMEKS